MVTGEHVTPEKPCKRVNIAAIIADIKFRGVTSDWQPAKKMLEQYKSPLPKEVGDDPTTTAHVLAVMDDDNIYGENFFMCKDEETALATEAKYAAPVVVEGDLKSIFTL